MSTIVEHGNGAITFSGLTFNASNIKIDVEGTIEDTTELGSAAVTRTGGGAKGWTMSCDSFLDNVGCGVDTVLGTSQTLTATMDTSYTYSGTAFLSGAELDFPANSPATISFSFTGSSTLTEG